MDNWLEKKKKCELWNEYMNEIGDPQQNEKMPTIKIFT